MRIYSSILLGLFLASQSASAVRLQCEYIFKSEEQFRAFDLNYIQNFLSIKNNNKVVEVTNQSAVQNQGTHGFCHMYSLYAEVVREYKDRNQGVDPEISIHYWTYFHWLNKAIQTAQNPSAGLSIPEGSFYENSFDIIKQYGVMTKSEWAQIGGRTDIEADFKNGIQLGQLKSVVERAHLEKTILSLLLDPKIPKGMTLGKYYSQLLNDPSISQQLKNFIQRKEVDLKNNKTQFSKENINFFKDLVSGNISSDLITKERAHGFLQILDRDIEKTIVGEFNSIYFGQNESPLKSNYSSQIKTAKNMFPELLQKTLTFITEGERVGPTQLLQVDSANNHLTFKTSLKQIEKLIKQQVDVNNSVWIGYDHNEYFVDSKTGAMSIEAVISFPNSPYVPRAERNLMKLTYGGHAVQIVGYEINAKNEIVAFKIQNSWGDKVGSAGYFRMDIGYFRAFVWRITVRDEQNEFNDSVMEKMLGK